MSGYCNDCGNTQCLCKEIEQQEKPTSSCMVDSVVLPLWGDVTIIKESERTALERFVYNHEPAGIGAAWQFRTELLELIQYVRPNA